MDVILKDVLNYKSNVRKIINISISTLRFAVGNYKKFNDSKYICFLAKLYCITVACCIIFRQIHVHGIFSLTNLETIEYSIYFFYYLVRGQEYMERFSKGLSTCDAIMGFKDKSIMTEILFGISVSVLIAKGLITLFWCYNISFELSTCVMMFSTEFNYLLHCVCQMTLYNRMGFIKKRLQSNLIHINIVGKDQIGRNVRVVRKCLGYYHNLLDNVQQLDTAMQVLYIEINMYLLVVALVISMMHVLAPSFITEMVNNNIDDIKSTLVTQIVRCSDKSLREELDTALQYIHRRPYKFVICGAVAVDGKLPFSIIGVCITYVILIKQFTHFVDITNRYAIGHIAIIEYLISVVFSLITAQDYLITFSKHLKTSDAIIGFKKLPLIKLDFLLPILVTFFVKSVLLSRRLKEGRKLLIVGLVGITDTNPIIISLILSSLYTRMVKIRERFDSNFVPINIVGKEQVKRNVRVVRKCLGYYNNLLDGMNRIDRTLQFLVSIYLIFSFPRSVGGLHFIIQLWLIEANLDIAILMVLEIITTITILSIPGIVSEMIKNEIDRIIIKSILIMQVIRCSGGEPIAIDTIPDTVLLPRNFRKSEKSPIILCPTRESNPRPLVQVHSTSFKLQQGPIVIDSITE
ncbi:hypothetical protein SFRURICE_008010 [Spodoptera frugiperda]|nr:hypothetical protein SFRURICE_008010 [Spodoptera frugiperda]